MARRRTFPLTPRHRLAGIAFGTERSARRGQGSDIAGSRPYRPGDRISAIDWRASARLSRAKGTPEFVVREHFAEEAPRAVVVVDRRPSMGLYPPSLPWLAKPDVVREATAAIVASALAARGVAGYLDYAECDERHGEPFWVPPHGRLPARRLELRHESAFDAPADNVEKALAFLARHRHDVPTGSFVFVLSDFLSPPPLQSWVRGTTLHWDLVPVVIQDPVWERSFPLVHSVVVPTVDPSTGKRGVLRLSRAEAEARRQANEARFALRLRELRSLGLEPVVLDTADPFEIDRRFILWAASRRAARRGRAA